MFPATFSNHRHNTQSTSQNTFSACKKSRNIVVPGLIIIYAVLHLCCFIYYTINPSQSARLHWRLPWSRQFLPYAFPFRLHHSLLLHSHRLSPHSPHNAAAALPGPSSNQPQLFYSLLHRPAASNLTIPPVLPGSDNRPSSERSMFFLFWPPEENAYIPPLSL